MKQPSRAPRPGLDDKRYLANRQRLRDTGNHICAICHFPIDTQLKYPNPLAWSCDHVIPRSALHPNDPRHWMIEFLREVHARCNSARGAKPIIPHITQATSIDW